MSLIIHQTHARGPFVVHDIETDGKAILQQFTEFDDLISFVGEHFEATSTQDEVVEGLEEEVKELEEGIDDLESKVADLETQVEDKDSEIKGLCTQIRELETELSTLKSCQPKT